MIPWARNAEKFWDLSTDSEGYIRFPSWICESVLRQVVPHAKAAFLAARPHLEEAASDVMKESASEFLKLLTRN